MVCKNPFPLNTIILHFISMYSSKEVKITTDEKDKNYNLWKKRGKMGTVWFGILTFFFGPFPFYFIGRLRKAFIIFFVYVFVLDSIQEFDETLRYYLPVFLPFLIFGVGKIRSYEKRFRKEHGIISIDSLF